MLLCTLLVMTKTTLALFLFLIAGKSLFAQYPPGDKWYNNPLGFEPVKLHTAMSFIVPAVAVGATILFTKNDSTFTRRLSIYNETGLSWGYKYPYTFMAQNNSGVNFQLRKFMSVGAEFDTYFAADKFNSATGFAIRPFARFYPVNNDKWRLYFESGGGFVYFLDNFPKPTDRDSRMGTQLNGTTKYGIGSAVNFNSKTSIAFGIRHLHVSNGNTKGLESNPSHDSNGFFIGLVYRP